MPTIDDYRQRIQKINERRDLLVTHMERMDDTNKHNHEILEDLEHSVRFLRQLNRDADIAASVISDADEVMEQWFEEETGGHGLVCRCYCIFFTLKEYCIYQKAPVVVHKDLEV